MPEGRPTLTTTFLDVWVGEGTVSSMQTTTPEEQATPQLRTSPSEILSEVRQLRFPRFGEYVATCVSVIVVLALFIGLVYGVDETMVGIIRDTHFNVPSVVRGLLWAFWVLGSVIVVVLSRSHKGPGADLAGAFSSTSSSEWGGMTPAERRIGRQTAVAVIVIAVSGLLLAFTG